jgi:ABC-2 type transport system permease protein
MKNWISWPRLGAIIYKEITQMRRDRLTFAMMIVIPIFQLIIFGLAINTNPKYLPTVVINEDISPYTRAIIAAFQNTQYFKIINSATDETESTQMLERNQANFVIHIPANFTRDVLRGLRPTLLVTADATDPIAAVNALSSVPGIAQAALTTDLQRGLSDLIQPPPPFHIQVHAKYNPEAITQFNIIPGLMGVVLTMTMVSITSLAITRERERGTMETLLSMPVNPLEVMLGKIAPYIMMGYIQQLLILVSAFVLFNVPFEGSIFLLWFATLFFIGASLTVGLTISTLSKNQLQAIQLAFFFFLPSILLSGFMFPVLGMPVPIQWLAQCFPLTHFLIVVRGIALKGNHLADIWPQLGAITLFGLVMVALGLKRFRRTLD